MIFWCIYAVFVFGIESRLILAFIIRLQKENEHVKIRTLILVSVIALNSIFSVFCLGGYILRNKEGLLLGFAILFIINLLGLIYLKVKS